MVFAGKISNFKNIFDGKFKSTEKYKKCDVVDRVSCLQHKMAHNVIKSSQMHIRMPKVGIFATKDQWYTMGYNANAAGDMQLAGGQ